MEINFKDYKIIDYANLIVVFFLLFFSSSFYAINNKGSIIIGMLLVTVLMALIINFKNIKINTKSLFFTGVIVFLSCLTMIFNRENIYNYIIFWIIIFCSYIIYLSMDFRLFINHYVKIMSFLVIYSLIALLMQYIFPQVIELFPIIYNTSGVPVYNLFFTVLYDTDYIKMNPGFFWEPGAYQTFILLSMIFMVYYIKKTDYKLLVLHGIALLTTFSTMAYIGIILFFLSFLFRNKIKFKKIFILALSMFSIYIFFMFLPYNIQFKLFGKFSILFDWGNLVNNEIYHSTVSRVQGIIFPVKGFFENPIFGMGFDGLSNMATDEGYGHLTATQINWFGYFGLFVGIMMNVPILTMILRVQENLFTKIMLVILMNTLIISQNYNRNAFFILIIYYGLNYKKENLTMMSEKG